MKGEEFAIAPIVYRIKRALRRQRASVMIPHRDVMIVPLVGRRYHIMVPMAPKPKTMEAFAGF